jgi:hypothetical protein
MASVVEQMAEKRLPLALYARNHNATAAFALLAMAIERKLATL